MLAVGLDVGEELRRNAEAGGKLLLTELFADPQRTDHLSKAHVDQALLCPRKRVHGVDRRALGDLGGGRLSRRAG